MSGFRIRKIEGSPLWMIGAGYYSPKLNAAARTVPGIRFEPKLKAHVGYADAIEQLVARLRELGLKTDEPPVNERDWSHNLLVSYEGARDYQKTGIDFLVVTAGSGALLADDMGLGKSHQAVKAARALRRKTVIVCPSHVRGVWERPKDRTIGEKGGELAKWWPDAVVFKPYGVTPEPIPAEADVVVIHYDIIYAWVEVIIEWGRRRLTAIFDECFPANTPVRTPYGDMPIDQLRSGDRVLNALGVGAVEAHTQRIVPLSNCRLIKTDDGREFITTVEHPIFTKSGWRRARELRTGDWILDAMFTHGLKKTHVEARGLVENREETLRVVPEDQIDAATRRMLLELLREEERVGQSEVSSDTTCRARYAGSSREGLAPISAHVQDAPRYRRSVTSADVQTKSDADAERQEAHDRNVESTRLETACARRQRQTGAVGRTDTRRGAGRTLGVAICSADTTPETVAGALQDRHRASDEEDRYRSRRQQPPSVEPQGSGRSARRVSIGARVASVTIPKRTDFERLGLGAPDDKGVRVFNLQVSDHPSYVVNGFVVHNCHACMDPESRRSRACQEIAAASLGRIALTGTPPVDKIEDLFGVLQVISPGRFGEKFWGFGIRYCDGHEIQIEGPDKIPRKVWDWKGKSNVAELRQRLDWFTLRRTKREVMAELPKMTRQILDVTVPAKTRIAMNARIVGDKRQMRAALDSAADGKLKSVLELIRGHLADGLRVVVATYRRAMCERIADIIGEVAPTKFIHGGLSRVKREKIVDEMRRIEGPCCLVTNIDVTATGIDLTFASVGVVAELVWEPKDHLQWESRTHRYGQSEPVLIQYVIARGTGDELILQAVINKLDNFLELVETDTGDGFKETLVGQKDVGLSRLAAALKKMGKKGAAA